MLDGHKNYLFTFQSRIYQLCIKSQSQNNIIRGQSLFGEALVTSSVSLNIDQYYTKWTLALVEYYYLLLK